MAGISVDGRCRILELPVELMEMIALFTDTSRLLNLRATCKDIEAKTRSVYIDCCLTDPIILLADRTSMSNLLAISKHQVFSKHVITITLALRELCGGSDMQCRMRALPQYASMDPRQQRSALRERQRVHQQLKDDEKQFRGEQEAMLIEILRNFMEVGRLPAICTVGNENSSDGTMPSGLARLQKILGHPKPLQHFGSRLQKEACNTVLRAIVNAEYPPVGLTLDAGSDYSGSPGLPAVDLSNLCLPNNSFRPSLLVQLSMTIDFGDEDYSDDNFDEEFDEDWDQVILNTSRLSALLMLATELKTLTLEATWNQEPWKRDKLLLAILQAKTAKEGPALMKLKRLTLDNVGITDYDEFLAWIRERRDNLHVVEVTASSPLRMVESGIDPNVEVWDAIWTAEKRDMKVLIGGRGPGMARGKYCDQWQDEVRWRPWPMRTYRYGGGHQNDDCDCQRAKGWQQRSGNAFDDQSADDTLHQSGTSALGT